MNTNDAFESAMTSAFARLADRAPVAADAVAITAAVASQRGSAHPVFGRRPWVVIIAAMLLLSLAMGAALIGL